MVDTIPLGTIPLLCEVGCHSSHSRNRWLFQRTRTWREWFIWPDGATVIIWCELPDNLIRIGKSKLLVPWCLFWWESGEVLIERDLALVYSGYTCSMMCFPLFFLDRKHCAWILLTFIYKDFRPWEGQGREADDWVSACLDLVTGKLGLVAWPLGSDGITAQHHGVPRPCVSEAAVFYFGWW